MIGQKSAGSPERVMAGIKRFIERNLKLKVNENKSQVAKTDQTNFGVSEYYRPLPEIDHWLPRRMRMCYWKQWRHVRTKVRNLFKLGTHPGADPHAGC